MWAVEQIRVTVYKITQERSGSTTTDSKRSIAKDTWDPIVAASGRLSCTVNTRTIRNRFQTSPDSLNRLAEELEDHACEYRALQNPVAIAKTRKDATYLIDLLARRDFLDK